jgi:hypothetical protein
MKPFEAANGSPALFKGQVYQTFEAPRSGVRRRNFFYINQLSVTPQIERAALAERQIP